MAGSSSQMPTYLFNFLRIHYSFQNLESDHFFLIAMMWRMLKYFDSLSLQWNLNLNLFLSSGYHIRGELQVLLIFQSNSCDKSLTHEFVKSLNTQLSQLVSHLHCELLSGTTTCFPTVEKPLDEFNLQVELKGQCQKGIWFGGSHMKSGRQISVVLWGLSEVQHRKDSCRKEDFSTLSLAFKLSEVNFP